MRTATKYSVGVRNASVGELSTGEGNVVKSGVSHAPLVDVAAVGQLHWGLFSTLVLLDVLVAAIQKGCHWVFLEEIQVPVPWPGLSAPPARRGERCT